MSQLIRHFFLSLPIIAAFLVLVFSLMGRRLAYVSLATLVILIGISIGFDKYFWSGAAEEYLNWLRMCALGLLCLALALDLIIRSKHIRLHFQTSLLELLVLPIFPAFFFVLFNAFRKASNSSFEMYIFAIVACHQVAGAVCARAAYIELYIKICEEDGNSKLQPHAWGKATTIVAGSVGLPFLSWIVNNSFYPLGWP